MNLLSSTLLRAAAVAVALPFIGLSVTINPNTLTYGIGNNTTGTSTGTVGSFSVASSYAFGVNSAGGTYIAFNPVVTYTGASPLTTPTTIEVDLFANIFAAAASNWNGTYTETIPLLVAANSTASAELLVDGQTIGAVSNIGPGSFTTTMSANLSGVNGTTLGYDYAFTYYFGVGTLPGASDSSPSAPEPATMIPAGLGLVGFGLMALRRRKK